MVCGTSADDLVEEDCMFEGVYRIATDCLVRNQDQQQDSRDHKDGFDRSTDV